MYIIFCIKIHFFEIRTNHLFQFYYFKHCFMIYFHFSVLLFLVLIYLFARFYVLTILSIFPKCNHFLLKITISVHFHNLFIVNLCNIP